MGQEFSGVHLHMAGNGPGQGTCLVLIAKPCTQAFLTVPSANLVLINVFDACFCIGLERYVRSDRSFIHVRGTGPDHL